MDWNEKRFPESPWTQHFLCILCCVEVDLDEVRPPLPLVVDIVAARKTLLDPETSEEARVVARVVHRDEPFWVRAVDHGVLAMPL